KKANACGILPLLLQNEMGTYAKGIKKLMFTKKDENYSLNITEGTEQYELKFNFAEGIRQKYEYCGNLYDCVVDARFILNGKGDPFLVIRMYFLEFASSRYFSFKLGKHADILSVEASENPGLDFILALLEMQDKATKALLSGLSKIVDLDVVEMRAKNVFSPTFVVKHTPTKID
ncbi:MAG: hypothetical protein K5765_00240, partial [Clostridia bacterium]|nr:hypothetical protein [Clostridia bacterium]